LLGFEGMRDVGSGMCGMWDVFFIRKYCTIWALRSIFFQNRKRPPHYTMAFYVFICFKDIND